MTSWLELGLCAHFSLIMLVCCLVEIVHVYSVFLELMWVNQFISPVFWKLCPWGRVTPLPLTISLPPLMPRFWSLNERWLRRAYYFGLGVSKSLPCCMICICVSLCCYQGKPWNTRCSYTTLRHISKRHDTLLHDYFFIHRYTTVYTEC